MCIALIPTIQAKLQEIADVVEDARAHPNQVVTVDRDDVTVTGARPWPTGMGGRAPIRCGRNGVWRPIATCASWAVWTL